MGGLLEATEDFGRAPVGGDVSSSASVASSSGAADSSTECRALEDTTVAGLTKQGFSFGEAAASTAIE